MLGLMKFSVWTLIANLNISLFCPLSLFLSLFFFLPIFASSLSSHVFRACCNYCDSQELNNMELGRRNTARCLYDSVKKVHLVVINNLAYDYGELPHLPIDSQFLLFLLLLS